MPAIGGSVESVTLSGREMPATADADVTRKLGGFTNEVEANGNGTVRIIKTRTPWSLDGVVVQVDDTNGDHEFLQQLADSNVEFPVVISLASGESYQAVGQISGDLAATTKASTVSLNLMGGGKATKQ